MALAVASTGGICGLLTVGYPSISDSGGYGECGFRPSGVPRSSASSWSGMRQPDETPKGAPWVPVADPALGNSVGAIGMVPEVALVRRRGLWGPGVLHTPSMICLLRSLRGAVAGPLRGVRIRVVSG